MSFAPSSRSAPPTADPTGPASSSASPGATNGGSELLTGVLAGRDDLETWVPETEELAQGVLRDVAAFCHDYCPARLSCVEEACRLYRLEARSVEILRPTPADDVGVLGFPTIGL